MLPSLLQTTRSIKVKLAAQELQDSCCNTGAHHFLVSFLGERQSILILLSSIFYCNIMLIVYFGKSILVISFLSSSAFLCFPFHFCKFHLGKSRLVISFLSVLHFLAFLFNSANFHSTSSFQLAAICFINFSFYRYYQCGEKRKKTNQKDFLSCLIGIEITQENFFPTPPLLHIANLLSSSVAVIKKNH